MTKGERLALLAAAVGAGLWLYSRGRRRYDFAGKVVLVTGGSRGLGLVLARELAKRNARVAICARDADELARAGRDIDQHGPSPLAVTCDLTDPAAVERLVWVVEDRLGPIDVLINNAGVIGVGPQEAMTLDDYRWAMESNFFSAVHTIQAVLPSMRARRAGRIVNISSIGGKVAIPHLLPYTASKFALTGYSEGLRGELAPDGVVVTTVCPGLMRTGSPRNATFKGQHTKEYAWFKVGDSIPGVTMSAESAAERILDACARGDAEVMLGLPAKLAVWLHGLFPGLTADMAGLVGRMLPDMGGLGTGSALGKESESAVSESFVTTLTDDAARRNNEMTPSEVAYK